jgi:hypothetical protein
MQKKIKLWLHHSPVSLQASSIYHTHLWWGLREGTKRTAVLSLSFFQGGAFFDKLKFVEGRLRQSILEAKKVQQFLFYCEN